MNGILKNDITSRLPRNRSQANKIAKPGKKMLALPSGPQVLQDECVNFTSGDMTTAHLLSVLQIRHLTTDTFFVPQLTVVGGLNTSEQDQPEEDQLRTIILSVFPDIKQPIIDKYMTKFNAFKPDQQSCLRTMLLQIQQTLLKTQNENIKTLVKSVITEPVCFAGQKNTLMQVLESNQIPSKTTATFELQFNAMIISIINKLAQDILNDINARIFFNAPDPQSTHQIEPVRKWLDENVGLYGGSYPEDVHNSTTPFVNQIIESSFKRVIGNTRLSLDYWVKAITDEINQNSNQCTMLCDYLNQIIKYDTLSQHYSPTFINELRDELEERAFIADPPRYSSNDFELILEKEGTFPPVFYPSERLIRELLSVNLKQMNRVLFIVTESGNRQTVGEESFCLRNGIRGSVIKSAHGTRSTVIETIKNLPETWSQQELSLFFHIILQKYANITNGIQFSDEEIAKLIQRLNEQNEHGETIVFMAAINGHADTIRVLAELGADVNIPNKNGCAPVYIAAKNGHADAIRVLAELGADVNTPNKNGCTAVYIAAQKGHADAIRVLKKLGADVNTPNNNGATPVFIAAQKGHVDMIRVLKELGANVNTPKNNGYTPVYIAAQEGQADAIRVLAEFGADVITPDKDGYTPVSIAAENGHADTIRVLAELGTNVNTLNKNGCPPVFIAAENGHADTIRVLAELGADVNTPNKNGFTPVYIAAQNGHADAIRILKKLGADVNTPNNNGATPVFIAAQKGHVDMIRVLKELGANVNTPKNNGYTPVFITTQEGHADAIRVLAEFGADVITPDKDGYTPVSIAAQNGHADAIRVLAELGADVNTPNKNGCTAVYIAAQKGHADAIRVLPLIRMVIHQCLLLLKMVMPI
jgi:ankyrin repeat protein